VKKKRTKPTSPGGGSSWNLAFCEPKNVLQILQNIKCFWKKNPINFLFRVQISPRVFPPNFFIEYPELWPFFS
jgi:hypothetical protein